MPFTQFALITVFLSVSAGITLAQDDITPVDREISDEQVLELVNTDYPGLDAFAEAMAAGELERAQSLLVEHFATREQPSVPPAEFPGMGSGNSKIVLQGSGADAAVADEKWLNHIFTISNNDAGRVETYELGEQIDWLHNPSEALSWNLYLNQLNVVSQLAGVYRDTGDEKYAGEIGDLIVSWTRQVPRGFGYMRDGEIVNSGMEVRNRLCNCIAAYDVVRKSPTLTPEVHMAFWKLFITACRELMTYPGTAYPGLIPAAVMYPEFIEAQVWLKAGFEDIHHQLVDRTTPEGAWDTHSIAYQDVPVPWAARSLEFLQANGGGDYSDLASMIERQAGKLLLMLMRITMPNGGMPNIGDTYGRSDWNAGAFLRPLSQWMALKLDAQEHGRLEQIEDPFERLKAALAIAQGSETNEPARASEGLPGTGYYLMRSSWEPEDARYLFFDLSAQALGHAHNDATHVELYAYGKPLLCDTGDYFLGWGYRTALHNAVEIDGQQQARGTAAAPMMPREWLSTPGYDLVDGAHGAFGELGVTQRRKIVFVKPDYYVLFDLLTGEGEHTSEQFFHFAGPDQERPAEVALDEETLAASTGHEDTANVHVIPANTEGMTGRFVEAQETEMLVADKFTREAMLGWIVTTGTFNRVKSPVVAYTREGALPQTFADVLFPVPPNSLADVDIEHLPVSAAGDAVGDSAASGLRIHVTMDRPAHDPEELAPELGENLALGCEASAEVNSGSIAADGDGKLTDGEPGSRTISAAVSSGPHQPDTPLSGRFTVQFPEPVEINAVVMHHGTWNGSTMLYPPEEMTVQCRVGDAWVDVPNPDVTWRDDYVAQVFFDAITTDALSVTVERPSGGRISMREFEAYRVPEAELARVQALREERAIESWIDTLLISHEGPGERHYGDLTFDGEMALIREDEAGRIMHLSVHRGGNLSRGDEVLVAADTLQDTLTRTWEGGVDPAAAADGLMVVTTPPDAPELTISDLRVERHPPQKGLAGGQPWAEVTWRTDRPATTQIQFRGEDGAIRRTILDRILTNEHSARVEFLLPDTEYKFTAISVGAEGLRAEATAEG